MAGRILIIDSVPTNRIVLRVKLATAYYDVTHAETGQAALAAVRRVKPDLIIAAADLSDMTGQAFCAALRETPQGARLPLILVLSGNDPGERLASLAAGADDVLERPVDDLLLLARLRSLLRARDAEAELELREDTRHALGLREVATPFDGLISVTIISAAGPGEGELLRRSLDLPAGMKVSVVSPEEALRQTEPPSDVILLVEAPGAESDAALALLPQMRASSRMRHAAILYVAHTAQRRQSAAALDMGASDLVCVGPDPAEIALRIEKQAARKRVCDSLRANMRDGLRAAVIDSLTGLHNRRYAMPHLDRVAERAARRGRPFSVLLADLDHFKRVNDTHGHAAGDEVLIETASRLRESLRAVDLVARVGGEEFMIVLPETPRDAAERIAHDVAELLRGKPVTLSDGTEIAVTLSIGLATATPECRATPRHLLECADRALYAAKAAGRDRVAVEQADSLPSGLMTAVRGDDRCTLRQARPS